jgi:hypothetical protein
VLLGLAGGALAGYLIMAGSAVTGGPSEGGFAPLLFGITGAVFGAPFGAIAFPLSYYLLVSDQPLARTFVVGTLGTVLFSWAGMLIFDRMHAEFNDTLAVLVSVYCPGALGLVVSCLALRVIGGRYRTSSSRATVAGIAIACAVLATIVYVVLHSRAPAASFIHLAPIIMSLT